MLLCKNNNDILIINIKKRGLLMEQQFGYKYKLKIGKHALDNKKSKKLKHIDNGINIGFIVGMLITCIIFVTFMMKKDIIDNSTYSGLIYISVFLYMIFSLFAYLLVVRQSRKIENLMMMRIVSDDREKIIKKMNQVIEFSDGAYIPVYEFINKKTTTLKKINININRQSEPVRLIDTNSDDESDLVKINISRRDYPEIDEEALIEKLLPFAVSNNDLEETKKQREVDITYQSWQERHTRALQQKPVKKQNDLKQLEHVSHQLNNETSINQELQKQLLDEQKELIKR